jgi:hypothetical protein
MGNKIKTTVEEFTRLREDVQLLAGIVARQAAVIQGLEARLAVCESLGNPRRPLQREPWWQNPVVSFQGSSVRDAGEQANVL